jgi:hypothetical protein
MRPLPVRGYARKAGRLIISYGSMHSPTFSNFRVAADAGYTKFNVDELGMASTSTIPLFDTKASDKVKPIFTLFLRRSSGHHPLLAGVLSECWVINHCFSVI